MTGSIHQFAYDRADRSAFGWVVAFYQSHSALVEHCNEDRALRVFEAIW